MRLSSTLASLVLAWACSGCTTVAVAISGEQPTAELVFQKAIQVDLKCISAPWWMVTEIPFDGRGPAMVLLYSSAAVMAYGIVDLPFTYAAYSFHRAQRRW